MARADYPDVQETPHGRADPTPTGSSSPSSWLQARLRGGWGLLEAGTQRTTNGAGNMEEFRHLTLSHDLHPPRVGTTIAGCLRKVGFA